MASDAFIHAALNGLTEPCSRLAEVICGVQRETTAQSRERGWILWPCQSKNILVATLIPSPGEDELN